MFNGSPFYYGNFQYRYDSWGKYYAQYDTIENFYGCKIARREIRMTSNETPRVNKIKYKIKKKNVNISLKIKRNF
jgi:hypothetical protein